MKHVRQANSKHTARADAARVVALVLLILTCAAAERASAQQQPAASDKQKVEPRRTKYGIKLKLDFDARAYEGTQVVRWVNRDDRPASVIFFHLYPNLRADAAATTAAAAAPPAPDEPLLEVTGVTTQTNQTLPFMLEDGGVTLRVHLREPVAPGASAEVALSFKGSVPEISPDETSLPAHVIQQVGAALRDTREVRRARDTNFSSRGVMLLGSFYPVLAVHDSDGNWQRRVEPSVGDQMFADAADYEVEVTTAGGVALFTPSGEPSDAEAGSRRTRLFTGENLRGFPVVAGRSLRSASQQVGDLKVQSVYAADHEKIGRRVLLVACDAARVFASRFGPLPFKTVVVTEAPLVAGLGSVEFSGLAVIASAFYVDFDSPAIRNLPELVREQRASVEDSLEFAAAQGLAHQWWGAAVGNDPERAPVLDEALAQWSALLYVREVHGEERAQGALEDQLRGVYQIYRTFGGEDMPADRSAREYRNSFQYAAIVGSKGAMMFVTLRQLLGEEKFFKALRSYYEANRLEVAETEDLRAAFGAEAEILQRRIITRTFNRWLNERHGDEDIAPPNPQLAAALGITPEQPTPRDRNAFSRLGRFFWRQMTRIR